MTKSKENVVRLEDITDIINKKFNYTNNIINFNEKEILCNINICPKSYFLIFLSMNDN